MVTLYETFLPIVQEINEYGGNFASIHISRIVLDTIDSGADTDSSLARLRDKMNKKMSEWNGLGDYKSFSSLLEAYYEAVFYLVAVHQNVALHAIPDGGDRGKTPDFNTEEQPTIGFEVKTIDVADPSLTYQQIMSDGLDAIVEAQTLAEKKGIGSAARVIAPHGDINNHVPPA